MSYTLYWVDRTISSYTGTLPHVFNIGAEVNPITSDTALEIGSNAFRNDINLSSIQFGNNLLKIAGGAFCNCANINYVQFGNSLSTIEQGAFYSNAILGVAFPNTVTGIGDFAFTLNSISSLVLPNSLKTIGLESFSGNSNMSSLIIGSGLSTISQHAFSGNQISSLTIPANITSIESYAFNGIAIQTLTIPNTLSTLGPGAFTFCDRLKFLQIGSSLDTIPYQAFKGCALAGLHIPSNITLIDSESFQENKISSLTIPNTVASFGSGAEFFDNHISSLTLGSQIGFIPQECFAKNGLTSLTLPSTVNTVWVNAFKNNSSLKTVNILNDPGNIYLFDASPGSFPFDVGVTINYLGLTIPSPLVFVRPKPYHSSITYTVNPNYSYVSSMNLYVQGPGASNYSFYPTSNWYKYNVGGLTISSNYSAYIRQYDSFGRASDTSLYRKVQTGYKPAPVSSLQGFLNVSTVTLQWDLSSSNGGAAIQWQVIRDYTQNLKYNIPGYKQEFIAPLLIPGSNLFSVEAVNDPGYSPRVYWSTVV